METRKIEIIIDLEKNVVSTFFLNCANNVYCAKIALNALNKFLKENDAL